MLSVFGLVLFCSYKLGLPVLVFKANKSPAWVEMLLIVKNNESIQREFLYSIARCLRKWGPFYIPQDREFWVALCMYLRFCATPVEIDQAAGRQDLANLLCILNVVPLPENLQRDFVSFWLSPPREPVKSALKPLVTSENWLQTKALRTSLCRLLGNIPRAADMLLPHFAEHTYFAPDYSYPFIEVLTSELKANFRDEFLQMFVNLVVSNLKQKGTARIIIKYIEFQDEKKVAPNSPMLLTNDIVSEFVSETRPGGKNSFPPHMEEFGPFFREKPYSES